MKKHNGHLPIQDNIDVISVKGIQAKRFLTLAGDLPIKIAVVTDNDGDYDNNIIARYKDFTEKDNIEVFSNKDNNQHTLEPSFVACNDEEELKKFLNYNGEKAISDYMQTCKSEWAYRVFSEENDFSFPQYINESVDWIVL
jgi:predicted ATP-dependent endonuclease of OLD family